MFKLQNMSDAQSSQDQNSIPKPGRVNEMCQEWMVREDGALAYHLQNEEIREHYSGNKYRNAVVREDFPRAKTEQLREQQLAEQAAAVYQRMLAEQEELDNRIAKKLSEQLDREERHTKRLTEVDDRDLAKQLLDKERFRVEQWHHQQQQQQLVEDEEEETPPPRPKLPPRITESYQTPKRQARPMPLPLTHDLYSEPYVPTQNITAQFDRIGLDDIGLPVDELTERQIQEKRDAELARKLQEEESGNMEDTMLNRDRMLAIEAQDKELAKLLQERERNKARRAREKAKQKALAKKQQQQQHQQLQADQLLPDDSYSYPADVIPSAKNQHVSETYAEPTRHEDDSSYSLPADVIPNPMEMNLKSNYSPMKNYDKQNSKIINGGSSPPVRPTQLNLRSPLTKINKPKYPDPENSDKTVSPSHLNNIAMAIDPTYPRRGIPSSSSYDTSSSTVTTSTSSSSPGMVLPPPDLTEPEIDNAIAPPYMPIQGQRRTSSLEKKQKKKNKDGGCKQQ